MTMLSDMEVESTQGEFMKYMHVRRISLKEIQGPATPVQFLGVQ